VVAKGARRKKWGSCSVGTYGGKKNVAGRGENLQGNGSRGISWGEDGGGGTFWGRDGEIRDGGHIITAEKGKENMRSLSHKGIEDATRDDGKGRGRCTRNVPVPRVDGKRQGPARWPREGGVKD